MGQDGYGGLGGSPGLGSQYIQSQVTHASRIGELELLMAKAEATLSEVTFLIADLYSQLGIPSPGPRANPPNSLPHSTLS